MLRLTARPQQAPSAHAAELSPTQPATAGGSSSNRPRPRGREVAVAEAGTVTWYAFKLSDTTYGIFDTFEGEDGRQAHLNGQIPVALGEVGPDLLARDPDIRTIDIIAVK